MTMTSPPALTPRPPAFPPPVTSSMPPRIPMTRRLVGLSILLTSIGLVAAQSWLMQTKLDQNLSVGFVRGTTLTESAAGTLDAVAALKREHPSAIISLTGHTGTAGEPALNLSLSQERAAQVRDQLIERGVPGEAISADGKGGTDPLPQTADESERAWQARLARVDIQIREH